MIIKILIFLFLFCQTAFSDDMINNGGIFNRGMYFSEVDGSPTGKFKQIKVSNGTLTDNGDGTATLTGGGTPGGSNTQVQFNDSGSFGGDAGLTYNKTTNILSINALAGQAELFFDPGTGDTGMWRLDDGITTTTLNQNGFYPEFQAYGVSPVLATWFGSGFAETRIKQGKFTVGNPSADTIASQTEINYTNSDYTNTAGAGSHILLSNDAGSQNVISSKIGTDLVAKWRTDNAGNISWASYSPLAPGQYGAHFFWVNGDYGDGGKVMMYSNTNGTIIGNDILGTLSPTAYLNLGAGTTTAGKAPLKFRTGAYNSTPEAGAVEWDFSTNENLAFTPNGTRYLLSMIDSGVGQLTSGRVTFATTLGRLKDSANLTFDGTTLTGAVGKVNDGGITASIGDGVNVLTVGTKVYAKVYAACTVQDWVITSPVSGSVVIDVWKDTYANFPPTVADTIAGSEKPTLSSATKNTDTNLTTWTTAISAGDQIVFNVDSATTVSSVNIYIACRK